MSVTVYGASDDLIEVEGDIREEFTALTDGPDLLCFSTGDVLRIRYGDQGVWRIEAVISERGVQITQAPENDDTNYSDRAVIEGNVKWVVHRNVIEFARG
jgi:hypothetical protein